MSYFIDHALWKENPAGYHFVNLMLHILDVILIYLVLSLILKDAVAALFAALLFAVHPVNTEAVNAISFREDMLVSIFFMSSLLFYIYSKAGEGRRTAVSYAASVVFFGLALFSKEMAIVLPLVIILYDRYFHQVNGTRFLSDLKQRYLWYILTLIFYAFIAYFVMRPKNPMPAYPAAGFAANVFTMAGVMAGYIKWIFLPFDVHATLTYPYLVSTGADLRVLASLFLIICLIILAVITYKRFKAVSFALAWFFITVLPVSNIYPLKNIMAARYLYIPVIGFCALISVLCLRMKTAGKAVLTAVIILFAILTVQKNPVWKDNISFWSDMARSYPDGAIAHYNLGNCLSDRGEWDRAVGEYRTALLYNPGFAYAHGNLGVCYRAKGMPDEAIKEFKTAVKLNSRIPETYHNIGIALSDKGLYGEALAYFKKSIEIDPRFVPAYSSLGIAYVHMNEFNEARKAWDEGLRIKPGYKVIKENIRRLEEVKP